MKKLWKGKGSVIMKHEVRLKGMMKKEMKEPKNKEERKRGKAVEERKCRHKGFYRVWKKRFRERERKGK